MKNIQSESIDFVFTSPPYNVGIKYDVYNDSKPYSEYLEWCRKWIQELYRILKIDGRFCLNHYLSCGKSSFRYAPLMDLHQIAKEAGFHHHSLAIWLDRTLAKPTAWGSWLSARAPYINCPFEGILIMYKNLWRKKEKGQSTIDKDLFVNLTRGIWEIQPEHNKQHPAPFPVRLVENALHLLTYEREIILDPFIGSGTSAIAAEKSNRRWIGIELSKSYCKLCVERLERC